MSRLVLINGPPASGKSTLARRCTDDHPLAMALDIDVVRSLPGGWLEQPGASGTAARVMALAMAREHLQAGHDVVVPQFLARPRLPEQLERLASEVDVDLLQRSGGLAALEGMRAQMLAMIAHRPHARFLTSRQDDVEGTYRDLLALITAPAPS